MKYEVFSDQVVTFEDALAWCEVLFKTKPSDIINSTLNVEPAAIAVAANLVDRMCDRLRREGMDRRHIEYISTRSLAASAITIELMRRGYGQFMRDLMESNSGPEEQRR